MSYETIEYSTGEGIARLVLSRPERMNAINTQLVADLRAAVWQIWTARDDRYSEIRSAETVSLPKVEMSYIGG